MTSPAPVNLTDLMLEAFQRDFPLVRAPFFEIGQRLNADEHDVLTACAALVERGIVARIGGVVRPNTLAASTLAAVAVPHASADAVATAISGLEGVNHVYLRENAVNIWFVATGPDRPFIDATLRAVAHVSGQPVLDLSLEQAFHIDLGFPLTGGAKASATVPELNYHPVAGDRDLAQIVASGIPLEQRPFRSIGAKLGLSEEAVISRLEHLLRSGVVKRFGLIVRHRALGWRSNAMVVWDLPDRDVEDKARPLAACDGINLCYRRRRCAPVWPYNLYCMIHAKSRETALLLLQQASRAAGLDGVPREILFSTRCYKQTGALIVAPKEAA